MQLFALGRKKEVITAHQAEKHIDYRCPECDTPVRVRKGEFRRPHFFHLDRERDCRQSGKSEAHLQVQLYIHNRLPPGEGVMEKRFASIGRVADVAWPEKKLVFEVQCSFISAQELLGRNRDYAREGYQVVWIFHDRRYNHFHLSAAEKAVRSSPHYFTDGRAVYDQHARVKGGRRVKKYRRYTIDCAGPVFEFPAQLPYPFRYRQSWPVSFSGDWFSAEQAAWEEAVQDDPMPSRRIFRQAWGIVKRGYSLIFRMLLEKAG